MRSQLGRAAQRVCAWAAAPASRGWGREGAGSRHPQPRLAAVPWPWPAGKRDLSSGTPADPVARAAALRAWVAARFGGVHAGVRVALSAEGGLGLEAGEDLPGGTALVTLPKPAQLGAGAASRCQDLARLMSAVPDGLPTAKTALCLLRERAAPAAEAAFGPYLDVLPRSFPTCPLFYSSDLVARMEYLPAMHQVGGAACGSVPDTGPAWDRCLPIRDGFPAGTSTTFGPSSGTTSYPTITIPESPETTTHAAEHAAGVDAGVCRDGARHAARRLFRRARHRPGPGLGLDGGDQPSVWADAGSAARAAALCRLCQP